MDKWYGHNNVGIETHPFPPFLPARATHLILGTFPTHPKNRRFHFFYAGRNNFFWRLLGDVYSYRFDTTHGEEAIREREKFLIRNNIALYNVIYRCRRIVAHSSKDTDLEVIEKSDVLGLIDQLPKLKTIVLAGSSGAISPRQLFLDHLQENNIAVLIKEEGNLISGSFTFGKRRIDFKTVYSTSGTNIGRYSPALEQYKKALNKF
jgi:hypoxanthine-DNA glycosylase